YQCRRLIGGRGADLSETREKTDDGTRASTEEGRRIVGACDALVNLAKRRIWRNIVRHRRYFKPRRHGKHPGLDQFAGVGSDNRRPEDYPARRGDDLDAPLFAAIRSRPVNVAE